MNDGTINKLPPSKLGGSPYAALRDEFVSPPVSAQQSCGVLRRVNKRAVYLESINPKLALGFLALFALVVSAYVIAKCKSSEPVFPAFISVPAPIMTIEEDELREKSLGIRNFDSQDDFKNYIDDGNRAYSDGIFALPESIGGINVSVEGQAPADAKAQVKQKAVKPKTAAVADVMISKEDALKYFSPGLETGFIWAQQAQFDGENIYLASEDEYFVGASSEDGEVQDGSDYAGETKVIRVFPVNELAQISTLPESGDLVLAGQTLLISRGNLLSAYSAGSTGAAAWQMKIDNNSRIVEISEADGKLYIITATKIDANNPCPVRPVFTGEQPHVVECRDIYHSEEPIVIDSVYSIFEASAENGAISKKIAFAGKEGLTHFTVTDGAVYIAWQEGGDYVTLFAEFANNKCKGLLPNYLLDKIVKLPSYNMSLLAKEIEMRALISGWVVSLSEPEQKRVSEEITARMKAYLVDHYRSFEKTGIAKIDTEKFYFTGRNDIAGRVAVSEAIGEAGGVIMAGTVSGSDVMKKLAWVVTGKTEAAAEELTVNNFYVLDGELTNAHFLENFGLQTNRPFCAWRFKGNVAFAAACAKGDPLFVIGFDGGTQTPEIIGQLKMPGYPYYLYPIDEKQIVIATKDAGKINVDVVDISLLSDLEAKMQFTINDSWVDFEASYRMLAVDKKNKLIFVPSGKGGRILSYGGGKIENKKTVSDGAVQKALFFNDQIFLASQEGVDVYSVKDWNIVNKVQF